MESCLQPNYNPMGNESHSSRETHKGECLTAQQAQAKRPALDTRRPRIAEIDENMTFPYELVEPPDPARRAPWTSEKEESASHHLFIIICFAQLRAENIEKHAQKLRNIIKWS